LEEGGAILEGADRGLAAKEIGGRAFHKLEAIAVGVIERKYYARVDFTGEVFFASEPSGLGEDASTCAYSVFHKFRA
jgi:hypothetical protein